MLFAVSKRDPDAAIGLVVVGIPVNRHRGRIIVTDRTLDLKLLDHIPGDSQFKIPDSIRIYGIQGIGEPVIEEFFGRNIGQHHVEHGFFRGKFADSIQLHNLKQYAGNHSHGSFAMGEDFPSWIQLDMIINDALDPTLIKVTAQDRCKSNSLRLNIFSL